MSSNDNRATIYNPPTMYTAATTTTVAPSYIVGGDAGAVLYGTSATWSSAPSDMNLTGVLSASDVKLDGVSMKDTLNSIQDRLAILVPAPDLLEKYESLKELYSQYKMMEALLKEEAKK